MLIVTTLLICFAAQAQVRKCTGPDGKVTYSDSLCSGNTSRESAISTNANTIDGSNLRREGQRIRADEETANAMQNAPPECKFKSYKNNDSKGKALADKAQLECVRNIKLAKEGLSTSKEDYALWRDHYDQTTSVRQGNLNRAVAADNAGRIARSNEAAIQDGGRNKTENRRFTCKPNILGTALDCK